MFSRTILFVSFLRVCSFWPDITDSKAYKAVVTVAYEKDLGYPKEVTVVMVHNKDNAKKLEVIKMY